MTNASVVSSPLSVATAATANQQLTTG